MTDLILESEGKYGDNTIYSIKTKITLPELPAIPFPPALGLLLPELPALPELPVFELPEVFLFHFTIVIPTISNRIYIG